MASGGLCNYPFQEIETLFSKNLIMLKVKDTGSAPIQLDNQRTVSTLTPQKTPDLESEAAITTQAE
ncbi:hypothetical protein VB005_09371 [Metarhizium brunneum]